MMLNLFTKLLFQLISDSMMGSDLNRRIIFCLYSLIVIIYLSVHPTPKLFILAGDDSDIPHLISDSDPECMEGDDDDDDDNEWDDVEDNDEEKINVLTGDVSCLFCPCVEPSVESLLSHCSRDHNFDLIDSCRRWSVDCISYIKMINYIRREVIFILTICLACL